MVNDSKDRKKIELELVSFPNLHVEKFDMKVRREKCCLPPHTLEETRYQAKNSLSGKSERSGFKMPDEV